MIGTIKAVRSDRGFGFISVPGQEQDVFFHCSELTGGLEFNEQLVERDVEFQVVTTEKGLSAKAVKPRS